MLLMTYNQLEFIFQSAVEVYLLHQLATGKTSNQQITHHHASAQPDPYLTQCKLVHYLYVGFVLAISTIGLCSGNFLLHTFL